MEFLFLRDMLYEVVKNRDTCYMTFVNPVQNMLYEILGQNETIVAKNPAKNSVHFEPLFSHYPKNSYSMFCKGLNKLIARFEIF